MPANVPPASPDTRPMGGAAPDGAAPDRGTPSEGSPDSNAWLDRDQASALERLDSEILALDARSRSFSRARLLAFGFLIAGLIAAATGSLLWLGLSAAASIVFIGLLFRHGRVLDALTRASDRRTLVTEALERQTSRRSDRVAPTVPAEPNPLEAGERVYAAELDSHELERASADDLGVFEGRRNLFAFLDRSSTPLGARRLRRWLLHPLRRREDIVRRQEALRTLLASDGMREALLESLVFLRRAPLGTLARALYEPTSLAGRFGLAFTAHVLGTAAPLLLLAAFFWPKLLGLVVLIALANLALIGATNKRTAPARKRLLILGPLLDGIDALGSRLGETLSESEAWREIAAELGALRDRAPPLRARVRLLELHDFGILFEILNVLVLWELRVLPRAETLFDELRGPLQRAAGALGEAEAYLSLASVAAEDPSFCTAECVEAGSPLIEARELAHPLLDPRAAVRNDLVLDSESGAHILILTGSNMSGKSTFLRASGINVLLAGIGAPVCARSFRFTPLAVRTDINVRDSLDDGKSYFQVEVERVHTAIRAAESDAFSFCVFDELFRGTNADERIALVRSILCYLRDHRVLALVATHDNALTRLVTADAEPGMANFHLREQVRGREMSFDYRIRPGPATTRNALRVLEVSGYPPEITTRARAALGGESS